MSSTASITALERKIANLKEETRKTEAILKNRRQILENREIKKQLKIVTRRHILTGKAMTALADDHPQIDALISFALNRCLTSKRDRALFDLPPLDAPKPDSGSSSTADADQRFPWLRNLSWLKDTTIRLFAKPSR